MGVMLVATALSGRVGRLIGAGAALALELSGLSLQAKENLSSAAGACDQTTQAAERACTEGARSDFFFALGTCANLKNAQQRQACIRDANSDLSASQSDCQDRQRARQNVCQALGQSPYDPEINPADFVAQIDNPYYPLRPGTTFVYRSDKTSSTSTETVTRETITILGVTCVIVTSTDVGADGQLTGETRDYFAQDVRGNVWYFGEATAEFDHGVPVSTEGSWKAGEDGAKPGIVMPAPLEIGRTYREEFLLGTAEDLARIEALKEPVKVQYGAFDTALKTFEFSTLDPDTEDKYYVREVGQVLGVDRETGEREELVSIRHE